MAETTYAVTQTEPLIEPTVLFVDRQEISKGKIKVTDDPEYQELMFHQEKLLKDVK